MLFLLNKTIIEVEAPELHLTRHWKRIGCGEPGSLMADDVISFAAMVVNDLASDGLDPDETTATDLAALIIAKTGANAALFSGGAAVKLNVLPDVVLENLKHELGTVGPDTVERFWTSAA